MRITSLVLFVLLSGPVVAVAEPASVLDLLNRVPELPATAQDAAKWFDKNGTLIHSDLLALKADLEAIDREIETAARKDAAATQATVNEGMDNVGIDMARTQRDPAYAKERQQRIRKMSPQEQVAFTQKLMRPETHAQVQDTKAMAKDRRRFKRPQGPPGTGLSSTCPGSRRTPP